MIGKKKIKPKPYRRLTCARCFRTTADGPLYRQGKGYVCQEHRDVGGVQ